ncbi:hypothetical protein MRX96_018690 [Rhipicephalus microplus]
MGSAARQRAFRTLLPKQPFLAEQERHNKNKDHDRSLLVVCWQSSASALRKAAALIRSRPQRLHRRGMKTGRFVVAYRVGHASAFRFRAWCKPVTDRQPGVLRDTRVVPLRDRRCSEESNAAPLSTHAQAFRVTPRESVVGARHPSLIASVLQVSRTLGCCNMPGL